MTDIFSVEKRSQIMSAIRSKNTKPEVKMANALSDAGIEYSMHAKLIGTPDFVMHDMGIVLFVDGEFWHGHTLDDKKRAMLDDYWVDKISRNIARDKKVTRELRRLGWRVIRVTDRQVNKNVAAVVSKVRRCYGQRKKWAVRSQMDAHGELSRNTSPNVLKPACVAICAK